MIINAQQWTPPTPAEVGDLIDAMPISQNECGRRIGVTRQSLNRWMGRANPPTAIPYSAWLVLQMLANELNVAR